MLLEKIAESPDSARSLRAAPAGADQYIADQLKGDL